MQCEWCLTEFDDSVPEGQRIAMESTRELEDPVMGPVQWGYVVCTWPERHFLGVLHSCRKKSVNGIVGRVAD